MTSNTNETINLVLLYCAVRTGHFGSGSHIGNLVPFFKKQPNIKITIVKTDAADAKEVSEAREDGLDIIAIPRPGNKLALTTEDSPLQKIYSRRFVDILYTYLHDRSNLVFWANSADYLNVCYSLKETFQECKLLYVHHSWSWKSYINVPDKVFATKWKQGQLSFHPKAFEYTRYQQEMAQLADAVITVTDQARNFFIDPLGIKPGKISTIYNGIDVPATGRKDKALLRKKYGYGVEEKVLLFAGRIREAKGLSYLLKAFSQVADKHSNVRLIIAGIGDFEDFIPLAKPHWNKVTYTGELPFEQIAELYQIADIGVLPSLYEQCSFNAIEMRFYRLPMIVSSVDGLDEMFDDGVDALKLSVRTDEKAKKCLDENELAEKIVTLLSDKLLVKKLVEQAHQKAIEQFTAGEMRNAYYQLLQNIPVTPGIPKIIHTCWMSGDPLPPLQQKCIDSWKELMPEYEIMIWNADNWDVNKFTFSKEAFHYKQWAFVSDVVRFDVLHEHGGIYLDFDVEAKKSFDPLLKHEFFTGHEMGLGGYVCTPYIIGACPENKLIKELLDHYNEKRFVKDDNTFDRSPNTLFINSILKAHGCINDENLYQEFLPGHAKYPAGVIGYDSPQSYAVHHFDGAWLRLPDRNGEMDKISGVIHTEKPAANGSIIKPVGNAEPTTVETRQIHEFIKTVYPCFGLIRYGQHHDGGYVLPDLDYTKCITIGVANDVGFESDIGKKLDCKFFLYDHTINHPPPLFNSEFHKIGLGTGSNELLSLDEIIQRTNIENSDTTLLKIDCEGGEWSGNLATADLSRIDVIVIELHWLDRVSMYPVYREVFDRIGRDFVCVNSHPNNYGGTFEFNGIDMPIVIEMSFISKKIYRKQMRDLYMSLNLPNNPKVRDIPFEIDLAVMK